MEELARSQAGIDPGLEAVVPAGVAFHHSGLTVEERELLEEAFSDGTLLILTCTPTLAAGVNLPAGRVVIRSPFVGMEPLDATRYRQMIGRAGRKGLQPLGEAFLMVRPSELPLARALVHGELPRLVSRMAPLSIARPAVGVGSVERQQGKSREEGGGRREGRGGCQQGENGEKAEDHEAAQRAVLEAIVHGITPQVCKLLKK
jgi:superfamily II DNA/RNA helicase